MIVTISQSLARLLTGLLCVAAVALALPRAAAAQSMQEKRSELSSEDKERMVEFLKAGKEAYQNGEFEKAIPFLEKAYEILPNPGFHYRIALAHERAGHPAEALEYYEKFLEAKPDSAKRGQIEKTMARLEQQVDEQSQATITVETSPGHAKVYVGDTSGSPVGTTPMTADVKTGEVKLVVEKKGYQTVSKLVEVEAGKSYQFSYSLPPTSGKQVTEGPRILPIVLGGIGVLGMGTATALEFASDCAISAQRTKEENLCTQSEYQAHATRFWAIGGVGAASLATAGILWATGGFMKTTTASRPSERAPRVRLRPLLSPTGVGLQGRF